MRRLSGVAVVTWLAFSLTACEPVELTVQTNGSDEMPSVSASPIISPVVTNVVSPTVTPSPVEQALASGDFRHIDTDTQLIDAINATLNARKSLYDGVLTQIGEGVGAITWDPTHDAAMLSGTFGRHQVLLETNATFNEDYDAKTRTLALAGSSPGKFIALGSNPMRTVKRGFAASDSLQQWLDNAITWLVGSPVSSQRIVLAQMGQNYYFPDQTSTYDWFAEQYPQAQLANDCSDDKLATCLAEQTDLLVISQVSTLAPEVLSATVEQAMLDGVPVLYMHYDGGMTDAGSALFDLFGIQYHHDNYWHKLGLKDYQVAQQGQLPANWQATKPLLASLTSGDYGYDVSCYGDEAVECAEFDNAFGQDFSQPANFLRATLNNHDANNNNVMNQDRLLALWVLLGDYYRDQIQYPVKDAMAASNRPNDTFVKAYLADHLVFNSRPLAPVPQDLGNFSRTDFSHITPESLDKTYTSRRHMRAAGVYALPGQTVQVTRTDTSDVQVRIQVNTQRQGSTKEWENYRRPEFLKSQAITLESGETIEFTSVYGGPIQVLYDANGEQVALSFENVGQHPYWASEADNETFAQAMTAGDYDWAEISTAGFEVHSQLEKMRRTIEPYSNAADLAGLVEIYTSSYPHALAGFEGPGVAIVDEVHEFAESKGWQIANIDLVKHMNADQPTCGWGCSGNPYDAGWNFSPTGHGDLHELGHGLERSFFRFQNWGGHSTTNFYSYYSKSRFYSETGGAPSCQSLPFEDMYSRIQTAQQQLDPVAYMSENPLNEWNQATGTHIQWFMAAQQAGVVANGFHVLPRLHIYERNLYSADNSAQEWAALAPSLGYTNLSLDDYKALAHNDRLLMAISVVTEHDMRDFFEPYGYIMSDEAAAELQALSLPVMPAQFFAMQKGSDYCLSLSQTPVAYDSEWPSFTE